MQPYEEKKIIKYVMQVSVKMHKWFNEVMGLTNQIKNIHAYIFVCIKKKNQLTTISIIQIITVLEKRALISWNKNIEAAPVEII